MSRLRLAKKLQPAKKAWKNFSNTLRSEVHKFNIPKAIKTTIQRLVSAVRSLRYLVPSRGRRTLTRPHSTSSYYKYHRKNFAAVSIDDLFGDSSYVPVHFDNNNKNKNIYDKFCSKGETSKGKDVKIGEKDLGASGSSNNGNDINSIEDAWKAVVAKSPQLEVDEKAEEFINKFRQDIKIQKERSLLEFQEMLARGT